MNQPFLHIDATPDNGYVLRILRAYRAEGDWAWSSSADADKENPLIKAMNDAQNKRNALLDAAIKKLEEG